MKAIKKESPNKPVLHVFQSLYANVRAHRKLVPEKYLKDISSGILKKNSKPIDTLA